MTNNRDYLSQEEIDALLKQTTEDSGLADTDSDVNSYLSSMEQDALGEIGNITFGSAATALSTLLGKKVEITTPQVSIIERRELHDEFPKPHVAVHVNYVDGFHGVNLLVIRIKDAQVIADLMMGGDGTNTEEELSEIHISAVQEAMNQMMGSSATSMSTIFNRLVNISPPGIDILDLTGKAGKNNLPDEEVFIKVSFRLKIGDLIDSRIMQLLPITFAKDLVSTLMGGANTTESEPINTSYDYEEADLFPEPVAPSSQKAQESIPPVHQPTASPMHMNNQPPYSSMPPQSVPPVSDPTPQQPAAYGGMPNRNINVQPVQFTNFTPGIPMQQEDGNLNLLLDIPLKVTVELGRSKMLIKDILDLSQGSIIELDKLAGEPVDILVNNKLIAKGEVVVIDENFGVRVTDIINQWDRIQKL